MTGYPNGIKSQHYFGPAFKPEEVRAISKDVVKQGEPAKSSMQIVPVSFSTYPYGKSSPTIIGDYAYMKSGGNRLNTFHKSDFEKYGLATHWEDSGPNFSSWKAAGEQNQEKVCVELPPETLPGIIIESFGERKLNVGKGTPVDLFVHDYQLHGIRNNRAGPAFHRVENLRQSFMNYLGTKFAQNHYSRLASLGYKSEDIGYLAIAFVDGVFYAVGRAPDGKIALSASIGTQTELEKLAKEWGLKAEDLRMDSFAEEITHIMRGSIDRVIRG